MPDRDRDREKDRGRDREIDMESHHDDDRNMGEQSVRLTNDDFRRLLMTPRAGAPSAVPPLTSLLQSAAREQKPEIGKPGDEEESDDRAERRRKKKSFYAKLKKQEEDKMAELAQKYRDRARERRDGANPDYQAEDPLSTASGYRAVAPDIKSGLDAAERRRQMIQESKFLGGDMEHTHLVKGLDYALLHKVRSEIQSKEQEEEEELERLAAAAGRSKKDREKDREREREQQDKEMAFKTKLGRNVYRAAFPSSKIIQNDMFSPGRMAYVIELETDLAESDIPTTLIRSKADVPSLQMNSTLTTNDIVINKLAQILSYLRQGRHGKRGKRKDKAGKKLGLGDEDINIYPDLADYEPTTSTSQHAAGERAKKRAPYFTKTEPEDMDTAGPSNVPRIPAVSIPDVETAAGQEGPSMSRGEGEKPRSALLNRLAAEPEGYAECYPGLEEMQDAIDDSDDEVDYTKMDHGNKKGTVGRWDFDTQEEYSEYMNNKEALPKAAFQYGVKMADGRRTRKYNKEKNEKAELDREWQKIQNIIQKRKAPSGSSKDGVEFKMPRY